jgi:hypothetical protein
LQLIQAHFVALILKTTEQGKETDSKKKKPRIELEWYEVGSSQNGIGLDILLFETNQALIYYSQINWLRTMWWTQSLKAAN